MFSIKTGKGEVNISAAWKFRNIAVCAVGWAGLASVHADITIDPADLEAFFGPDTTGIIVYVKPSDSKAYFVDFSESPLQEKPLCSKAGVSSPMLSLDGTLVAFGVPKVANKYDCSGVNTSEVFLCRLQEGATYKKLCDGFDPRFWVKDGKTYVIYRTAYCKATWPNQPGETRRQQVDPATLEAIGSHEVLYSKGFGGGLSKSGRYLCTAYNPVEMWDFVNGTVYHLNGGNQACNASITPTEEPSREDRMMHLALEVTIDGHSYTGHETIVVRDRNDNVKWYAVKPSGSREWQEPEWSTDENFCTATADFSTDGTAYHMYMVRMTDNTYVKVAEGNYSAPHLWLGPKNTAALTLSAPTVEFVVHEGEPAPAGKDMYVVLDGTEPSSVNVSTPSEADWLTVTKAVGGDTVVLTNEVDPGGVAVGTHTAEVTVSAAGAPDVSYSVVLDMREMQHAASIVVTPGAISVRPGTTVSFSAEALDQYDQPLDAQPAFSWSVSGEGEISSEGLYVAPESDGGPYEVICEADGVQGSAQVTIDSSQPLEPVRVIWPNGGERLHIDDEVVIKWECDIEQVSDVRIQVSVDGGISFLDVTTGSSIDAGQEEWGAYPWTVPATIGGESLLSSECLIRVEDYDPSGLSDISDARFSILDRSSVKEFSRPSPSGREVRVLAEGGVLVRVPDNRASRIRLMSPNGATIAETAIHAPGTYYLTTAGTTPAGVYFVKILHADGVWLQRVVIAR